MAERIIMKNVLLTGAAGGLGSSVVTLLATRANGTSTPPTSTWPASTQLATNLPNITPIHMDVTNVEKRASRPERDTTPHRPPGCHRQHGRVVCFLLPPSRASPIEDCERIVQVNALGMVRVNATFFDMVEKAKGIIVNTSSSTGWMTAQPFAGAYTMSKKAVEGYNDSPPPRSHVLWGARGES
ncbi:MAG: SDR family NAD(P)-dependent oxidoreductase [Lawsonella clevelandensis]